MLRWSAVTALFLLSVPNVPHVHAGVVPFAAGHDARFSTYVTHPSSLSEMGAYPSITQWRRQATDPSGSSDPASSGVGSPTSTAAASSGARAPSGSGPASTGAGPSSGPASQGSTAATSASSAASPANSATTSAAPSGPGSGGVSLVTDEPPPDIGKLADINTDVTLTADVDLITDDVPLVAPAFRLAFVSSTAHYHLSAAHIADWFLLVFCYLDKHFGVVGYNDRLLLFYFLYNRFLKLLYNRLLILRIFLFHDLGLIFYLCITIRICAFWRYQHDHDHDYSHLSLCITHAFLCILIACLLIILV
ncbi:hypothetical protein C8Q77DRAFT_1156358 [Trametes polyzona]|nr:hypothetical protein C8Q77DRAFT_1156358 [Trametes polyzona]